MSLGSGQVGPVLAFDIETVPDTEGLTKLYGLDPGLDRCEVAEIAFQQRRQATGSDFLALHLHRVVAIACALRDRDAFIVWSLGSAADPEAVLIQRFFDGIEKYKPQLVSWNGGGFDLPVLHYRALIHGIQAARYWQLGDEDYDFRRNNYISRYHTRHLDLMDVLALYQPRANAPLHEMARLCGFPGKRGLAGSMVWEEFCKGTVETIRNYCETDVLNTYLLFLRFQLMRGMLVRETYQAELEIVRTTLERSDAAHWRDFLSAWSASAQTYPTV